MLTFNQYQKYALRTANTDILDKDKLLINGAMGLNGESGEVIDIVKKYLFQEHDLDKDKLIDELSDVAWYLAVSAYSLGVTLEYVCQHNVEKLLKRYPEGFSSERSINRNE